MKCNLCNKYIASSRLRFHIKHIHTTESNNSCTVCGKAFKLKLSLKTHIKNCPKPKFRNQKCRICDEQFTKKYLRDHVKYVHGRTTVENEK